MPDKSCVFNCQSNYHNRPKETFFPLNEKNDYDLRQRWIRFVNREGSKPSKIRAYVESIFKPHYYKTGAQRKRYRLVKNLKQVPTIFDSEKSHLLVESKSWKPHVSIPRKSPTKKVYQQDQFKLFEEQNKIKNLMILILR